MGRRFYGEVCRGTKAPPADRLEGSPLYVWIYVEDVDAVVDRAVKLGVALRRSPQDQIIGVRDAFIVDLFGHGWTIATHLEGVSPDEIMRRIRERRA